MDAPAPRRGTSLPAGEEGARAGFVEVTLGADGLIQRIVVGWGTAPSGWTYTVDYRDLGTSPAIAAPPDAQP